MKIVIDSSGTRVVSDADYAAMKHRAPAMKTKKRDPASVVSVEVALARKAVCEKCEDTLNFGDGCRWHSGCCFGKWRTDKVSKCPHSRW